MRARAGDAVARRRGVSGPLERLITQSGLKITVGTLVMASCCWRCIGYLLVNSLTYYTYLGLAAAPAVRPALPYLFVRFARDEAVRRSSRSSFPEAIELMARALRAGHAFPTGLQMVADEIPDPVGAEFKLLYDRQNFGMSAERRAERAWPSACRSWTPGSSPPPC